MSTKPISARNFLLRKLWTTCFLLSAQHIHNIAADVDGDERPPICSSRILSESVDSFYSCALLLLLLLISSPFLQHSVFFTFSISNQPIKMKLFWGQLICIYEKTLLSLLTAFQRGTINSAFAQFSPIYFNYQKCNWRPYISDCHSQGHANKIPIIANPFHFCFAHLVPYFRLIMCVPYTKLSKSHSILITYCVRYFSSSVVFCGNKKETTISVISACHRTWNIFISHSCKNKRKTAHAQHSTAHNTHLLQLLVRLKTRNKTIEKSSQCDLKFICIHFLLASGRFFRLTPFLFPFPSHRLKVEKNTFFP